MSSDEGVS